MTTREPGGPERVLNVVLRHVRRVVIFVIGATVVLIGVVMFVTPGPALIVIPIGLAILAIEFAWARRLLRRVRRQVETALSRVSPQHAPPTEQEGEGSQDQQASARKDTR